MAETAAHQGAEPGSNRPTTAQTRYLSDPEDVGQVFKLLRDLRADLQLRFDAESAVFTAKVLDLHGTSVLIEDIQPRDGMRLLRTGRPFSISVRTESLYVHSAHNEVHKTESERSVPYFHMALPKTLLFQQRRKAMRHRLPLRVTISGAQVTLFPKDTSMKPLTGAIIDVSSGGCRAEFSGFKFSPIQEGEPLDSCALEVPKVMEFSTEAAIRHTSFDAQRRLFTCGIEFTEMHVTDRRRLEQFIESMSRGSSTPL